MRDLDIRKTGRGALERLLDFALGEGDGAGGGEVTPGASTAGAKPAGPHGRDGEPDIPHEAGEGG